MFHFKNHPYLNKLFNKNNMKLPYSCTPNMAKIISSHNKKLLDINPDVPLKNLCNCAAAKKQDCPLDGKCLATEIVYQADVMARDNTKKRYIGLTAPTFKQRLSNHTKSFNHREYQHETKLSVYIWQLKEKGLTYNIKWKILKFSKAYSPVTQTCRLCFDEKMLFLKNSLDPDLLNKRDELFSKCRHRLKHLLMKVK